MAPNYNCSGPSNEPNQALGILLCLVIIAYISYVHTTLQGQPNLSQEQVQNAIDVPQATFPPSPISDNTRLAVLGTPYDRGYYDGIKAYIHFDIADIRRIKNSLETRDTASKKQEKTMEEKLENCEKDFKQMQRAMKEWREEYMKALWEAKQKGEKGLLPGWLKFGNLRASTEMVKEDTSMKPPVVGNEGAEEKSKMRYDGDLKRA